MRRVAIIDAVRTPIGRYGGALATVRADDMAALVIGEVVGIHIDERVLTDGMIDYAKLRPIARLGYRGDYVVVDEVFEMIRPSWP